MASEVQDGGVASSCSAGSGLPSAARGRRRTLAGPSRRRARAASGARRRASPHARPGDRGAVAAPGRRGRRREPAQGRPLCQAGAGQLRGGRAPRRAGRPVPGAAGEPTSATSSSGPCGADRRRRGGLRRSRLAYTGDLLPEALYEEWTQAPRERLRSHVDLLRRGGQWERLVEVEPTDEPAYREPMGRELAAAVAPRRSAGTGAADRPASGARDPPSGDTEASTTSAWRAWRSPSPPSSGARSSWRARPPCFGGPGERVGALVVRGPAGIGKSAFCREVARVARAEGWMVVGRGDRGRRAVRAGRERGRAARGPGPRAARASASGRSVLAELTALAGPARRDARSPVTR